MKVKDFAGLCMRGLVISATMASLLLGINGCAPLVVPTQAVPTLVSTVTALQTPSPVVTGTPAVTNTSAATDTPDMTQTLSVFETQKASAAQTLAYLNTSQPLIDPPRPTGIIEMSDPSFTSQGYFVQNSWQQQLDGHWAQAYAGSMISDPMQGMVIITWDLPGRPSGGVYITPSKNGSVKIVAESNYRLTLQSESGTTFYFDVPGQTFVSSLTDVVPTVTQAPTFTPAPPTIPVATGYPNPNPTQTTATP